MIPSEGSELGEREGQSDSFLIESETTTETTTEIDEELAQISKAYENEIGPITSMIADDLKDASTAYPLKWILDAIHEAAVQNKRGWKYCLAILKRWKEQGNQNPVKPFTAKATDDPKTDARSSKVDAGIATFLAKHQEASNG
jgi:DnaD/phage-associated family protein